MARENKLACHWKSNVNKLQFDCFEAMDTLNEIVTGPRYFYHGSK